MSRQRQLICRLRGILAKGIFKLWDRHISLQGAAAAIQIFLSAWCMSGQVRPVELVSYRWSYQGTVHGTIQVPPGYKEQTENYGEGIVTHLRYPDGSYIILQHGGMYAIPMLRDSEYLVSKVDEDTNRKVRRGPVATTPLRWREDNLKRDPQKRNQIHPLFYMFPPNIAYDKVRKDKGDVFDKALDSFEWQTRR
jgi:hypothetical protein